MPPGFKTISSIMASSSERSALYYESKDIAIYIVQKELGQKQKWNRLGEKMYELCLDMKLKHEPFFGSIKSRLTITRENIEEVSRAVMLEMLSAGCNNGRIVSLYTFCMVLATSCIIDNELADKVDTIINITAEIVNENHQWFDSNNGWDGFMQFFTKPSDKLWKGFVWTTVGLGAVAGLLYANS